MTTLDIPGRASLLIEACLGSPAQRASAWNQWLEETKFDDIDPHSFELLPSVAHLNREAPLPQGERLLGLFRHNWALAQGRVSAVLPVIEDLQRSGLRPMGLKALALCPLVYGSFGARRFSDIDLMVPPADFEEAVRVLRLHGLEPAPGFSWPRASVKSWAFYGPRDADLDLHVRPIEEAMDDAGLRLFTDGASTAEIGNVSIRVPSSAACLVAALMHGLRFDTRGPCRWIVDAGLLIKSGRVDWDRFRSLARDLELEYALSRGLGAVSKFLDARELPPVSFRRNAPVLQRVEQAFRVRPPEGALGALPNLYFLYRRERRARLWRGGFAGFLRGTWSLQSGESLTGLLLRKGVRRILQVPRA